MKRSSRFVGAAAAALGFIVSSSALVACIESDEAADGLGFRSFASEHYDSEPGEGVVFFDYALQSDRAPRGTGAVLTDIVNHLPDSYGNTYYDSDPITWGHETSHGIHSHLRNYFNDTNQRVNGFYVPGGRGVLVEEPNIRKSAVARFVPQVLRGSRFDLYITGSQSWDDTPLYVWDEWNAYVNGGEVGVDLVNNGLWNTGWRDGVAGQLEFTVYAIALAMAVAEEDPAYFASNKPFKEFLAFNTRRAMEVYREGAQMEDFAWDRQDSYMRAFETDPSAEPVRAFARGLFGEAWANHVLFDGPAPDGGQSPDPDPEMQGPDPDPEPGSDPQDPAPDPDPGSEPETPGDGNDAQSPDMSDAGEGGQNEGWVEDDAQTPNRGVGFRDDARPPVRSCQQAGQAAPAAAWWPLLFVAFVAVRRQWVLR